MHSFYDYLAKSTKEYRYRIRTVLSINDILLDRIENILEKYDLVSFDGPKKTIMQARPLDFISMPAAEVYIIDATTHIPASPYILQQELRHALNVPDSFIIVRSDNDPNEIQLDQEVEQAQIDNEAARQGLRPASLLSSDPAYAEYMTPDTGPIAGDEYTKKFLKYLAKVKAERTVVMPDVQPEKRRMFDYLRDTPLDPEYFIEKPYVKPVVVKAGVRVPEPAPVAVHGNFDDSIKTVAHAYRNKDGEKILVTAKKIK